MERRIDYLKVGRGVYEAMLGLEKYLGQSRKKKASAAKAGMSLASLRPG